MRNLFLIILLLAASVLPGMAQSVADSVSNLPTIALIEVKENISPTTSDYINRGIEEAKEMDAQGLIVQLDTPGGLLKSTQSIVQAFLDSEDLPIIVYVAPEGASAASAGTFITMAAHIAAMAPATNIGAASPVQVTPGGGTTQPDTVMQKKIFNYSESYIKSIAERRDRNADWAISAVRDGESITANRALKINVIDLIASDRQELLKQIDGREIAGRTLQTRKAVIKEIPKSLAENFLGFIIRPEVILILTMIAIYGIIGEVTNPGAIIPGVAGVIALILVLYSSAAMPLNIAGFALIGLAIILFIAEAFTPAFGLLIAGGSVSFFLGALFLFEDLPEPMTLSWVWIVPATLLTALFFIWIAAEGIRIQFTKNHTGKETMIGKHAEVTDTINQEEGGRVFVNGEYWNAVSENLIVEGEVCEITEIQGLTLKVQPLIKEGQESTNT